LEVAKAGGVHALVTLARSCKLEGVLEQVKSRSHLHAFFFFYTTPIHVYYSSPSTFCKMSSAKPV